MTCCLISYKLYVVMDIGFRIGWLRVFQVREMSFCLISWSVQGFIFSSEKFLINWKCLPTDLLALPMF